jgi:8-oxo-dGTP diphosphatase
MPEKKRPGVGIGIMIMKDNKVLLGKRHDDPDKADSELHGAGTWTMPGGKLHFLETPEQGAIREVKEETGLDITKDDLKLISLGNEMVEDAHFLTLGFLCENIDGTPKALEPDEITTWEWFDLDSLPKPLFFPTERMLKNYLAKEVYKH